MQIDFRTENRSEIFILFFGLVAAAAFLAFLPAYFTLFFIFFSILIAASIKKIEIALFFLTVYIPLEPFLLKFASDEAYPFLKYGTEAAILVLFLIVIVKHLLKHNFKYIKTPIDIPLAIFFSIAGISALINLENPVFFILGLRQIFRYTLLYYLVIYSEITRDTAKKIIILLVGVMILESTIGLGQAAIGKRADEFLLPGEKREFANITSPDYVYQFWSSGQRVFATMGRYDRLGTFLCLAMLIIIGLIYELKNKKDKRKLVLSLLVASPALILSYSRMAWIGFFLGFLFIAVFIKQSKKIKAGFALVCLLLAVYLWTYIAARHIKLYRISDQPRMEIAPRFLSLFSLSELRNSYRTYGRLYFIVYTPLKVVRNSPLFGVGLGQYGSGVAYALNNRTKYDELGLPFGIEDKAGQIDNNWFSIWGETGTLGLIAFIFIIYSLFVHSLEVYKQSEDNLTRGLALGFCGVILAVSFQSFLGPMFEIRTLSFNFWLLGGLVALQPIK